MLSRIDDDRRGGSERRFYTLMVHRKLFPIELCRPSSRSRLPEIEHSKSRFPRIPCFCSTKNSCIIICDNARGQEQGERRNIFSSYPARSGPNSLKARLRVTEPRGAA